MSIVPRTGSWLLRAGLLLLTATSIACRDDAEKGAPSHSYFVAPNGSPSGDGSSNSPWDLTTALSHPQAVGLDDVIWLRGGTYTGNFISSLSGGDGHRITLRQQAGERAIIDGSLEIRGQFTTYWGFEVTNSETNRTATTVGADPTDYDRPTAVVLHGPGTRLVNLVIHDGGSGIGSWADAKDAEIYGCIIYNNGWQGPLNGHGVGIASQNEEGTKRIIDNVIFQQFDNGLSIYGSDEAHLAGFDIEGNVSFLNGVVNAKRAGWDYFLGGGAPAERIRIVDNYSYRRDGLLTARLGYELNVVNQDLELANNYLVGQTELVNWSKLNLNGNVFAGAQNLLSTRVPTGVAVSSYSWKNNRYLVDTTIATQGTDQPFQLIQDTSSRVFDLAGWQKESKLDGSSKALIGRPTENQLFLRPNKYDPNRSLIVVYNWQRQAEVSIDASSVLKDGDSYEIRSVHDLFGEPLAKGVFVGHKLGMPFLSGGMLSIPMRAVSPVLPIGSSPSTPTSSEPEFGVYILLRTSSGNTDKSR